MSLTIQSDSISNSNGVSVQFPDSAILTIDSNGIQSSNGATVLLNTPSLLTITSDGIESEAGANIFPPPKTGASSSGNVTGYASAPSAPTNISFSSTSLLRGSGTFYVSFEVNDGGAPIIKSQTVFDIQISTSTRASIPGYPATVSLLIGSGSGPYFTLGGVTGWLTPGTSPAGGSFRIRVKVKNEVGESEYSGWSDYVTMP